MGKKRLLLYHCNQYKVGGIEMFNMTFCKRMAKYYDITFLYDETEPDNLKPFEGYAKTERYDGQFFDVDICIYSSAWGKRPEDHIKAKKYIQMVHADYSYATKNWSFTFVKTPKTSDFLCGGENIKKQFKIAYNFNAKVIHYMLEENPEVKQVLHLITTSRISAEKGFERIITMAHRIKESGRKFIWLIYGYGYDPNYEQLIKNQLLDIPEVVFLGIGRNLSSYVADADYMVQLSDSEGWCFAMAEALQVQTPVIATNFNNAKEMVTHGKNGWLLEMDLSNLDEKLINDIYTKIPKNVRAKDPETTPEDWYKAIEEANDYDTVNDIVFGSYEGNTYFSLD